MVCYHVPSCSVFSALRGVPDTGVTDVRTHLRPRQGRQDQAVCAQCGRTLLAGEWTQTIVDEHGDERLICSLCGQARAEPGAGSRGARTCQQRPHARDAERGQVRGAATAGARACHRARAGARRPRATPSGTPSRRRTPRSNGSRPNWRGLRPSGRSLPAGSRASARPPLPQKQRRTRLAGAAAVVAQPRPSPRSRGGRAASTPKAGRPQAQAVMRTRPGGRRYGGERPRAGRQRRSRRRRGRRGGVAGDGLRRRRSSPSPADEAEQPARLCAGRVRRHPAHRRRLRGEARQKRTRAPARSPRRGPAAVARRGPCRASRRLRSPSRRRAEAEEAASLTLLQRGVDLLNVSRVPHKIAETNEELGLPHVHVGFDGETVAITFMWTMGWYRFHVDLDSGDVGMDDRGYEELTLQPNAGVRADGTVQLAPAQISRAAAQRARPRPSCAAHGPVPSRRSRARGCSRTGDAARSRAEAAGVPQQVAARPAQRRRDGVLGADQGTRLRLGQVRRAG